MYKERSVEFVTSICFPQDTTSANIQVKSQQASPFFFATVTVILSGFPRINVYTLALFGLKIYLLFIYKNRFDLEKTLQVNL